MSHTQYTVIHNETRLSINYAIESHSIEWAREEMRMDRRGINQDENNVQNKAEKSRNLTMTTKTINRRWYRDICGHIYIYCMRSQQYSNALLLLL